MVMVAKVVTMIVLMVTMKSEDDEEEEKNKDFKGEKERKYIHIRSTFSVCR